MLTKFKLLIEKIKAAGYLWVEERPEGTYFSLSQIEVHRRTLIALGRSCDLPWQGIEDIQKNLKELGFELIKPYEVQFDVYLRLGKLEG